MLKIVLPAQIHPPTLRRDGTAKLTFDTRELDAEEIFTIMSLRHSEGWICFAPNQDDLAVPDEKAEVDEKSPSERLRSVMYVWYKQETEKGSFVGTFDTFRKERMEKIIETIKNKLN